MHWTKCAVCGSKIFTYTKEQEASELLRSLGMKMSSKQPRFKYSAWWPLTKKEFKKSKIKKKTGDSKHIYQNELHKPCFQHDMAYDIRIWLETWLKDIPRRVVANTLCKKVLSMVFKFFDERVLGGFVTSDIIPN